MSSVSVIGVGWVGVLSLLFAQWHCCVIHLHCSCTTPSSTICNGFGQERNKCEPDHEKTVLMSYANNKGADQPAHPRSLISTFVVCCLDGVMSLVSVTKISSLMLASVAEQASLSLTWSETPEDTFSYEAAHVILLYCPSELCSSATPTRHAEVVMSVVLSSSTSYSFSSLYVTALFNVKPSSACG